MLGTIMGGRVLLLSLAITALLGTACGTPSAANFFSGRTLTLRALEWKSVSEVRYTADDSHYLVQPKNKGNTLIAIHLQVINFESNYVILTVDKSGLRLRDDKFEEYRPLDPLKERVQVAAEGPREGDFSPFIWGDLELSSRFEVIGWIIFEVPRGAKPRELIWDAADTIYLQF